MSNALTFWMGKQCEAQALNADVNPLPAEQIGRTATITWREDRREAQAPAAKSRVTYRPCDCAVPSEALHGQVAFGGGAGLRFQIHTLPSKEEA